MDIAKISAITFSGGLNNYLVWAQEARGRIYSICCGLIKIV